MKKTTVSYGNFSLFIMLLVIIGIIYKLGIVALSEKVDGIDIKSFATSRNTVENILLASRGNILDVNGEILANTVNSYTLIAYLSESRTTDDENPKHVIDIEKTALALSGALDLDYDVLVEQLSKDKYQVEILRDITELTKSQIDELNLVGIGYIQSNARYYQNGTFVSYLIGYAKKNDDGKIVGEMGIEGYYNTLLTGTDGLSIYQKDAYGYTIPSFPAYETPSVSGADVYLTIDSSVQLILENAINKFTESEHEWALLTVMDAKTGAIVGSATSPSFNPNDLNTIENNYLNPLVSYQYEPGSTMKTFSFGAAIEEGIYDGDALFTSGSVEVADATISDYNKVGWGDITYATGYAYSSNVATTNLALELGSGVLTDYYKKLGFGTKTGIELSNEYSGVVKFLYSVELANAAFGQGISVTPIQMLQAYSVITNEGTMLKPYIVSKIVDDGGKEIYTGQREEVEKIFSKETVEELQKLMHMAVYENVSSSYIPDNVNILGKTGTAQIAGSGGYLEGYNDYVRSFVSIFPDDEPEYILYMVTSKYEGGSNTMADITVTAIEEIAALGKNFSNEEKNNYILMDNYISKKISDTESYLMDNDITTIIIGDGEYISNQYPEKNSKLFSKDTVILVSSTSEYTMPNIENLSLSEAKVVCNFLSVECIFKGDGEVTAQSIKSGKKINEETTVEITLK